MNNVFHWPEGITLVSFRHASPFEQTHQLIVLLLMAFMSFGP